MKNLLVHPAKELYTKCEDIKRDDQHVVKDMLEVFCRPIDPGYCIGVGLAANQIGHLKRVILFSPAAKKEDITIMHNPVIVNHGREILWDIEGCLSHPKRTSKIGRYRVIDVEYYDLSWNKVKETHKGFSASIIQHELDHLNGLDCLINRED